MLSRLNELKALADSDSTTGSFIANDDGEYKAGKEPLDKALAQDAIIRKEFASVRSKQEQLQELIEKYPAQILPRQLKQWTGEFDQLEEVCQSRLVKCKALIAKLREATEKGQCQGAVFQIRAQLEHRAQTELIDLMKTYFDIHIAFRDERKKRMQRQLRYAYPDSTVGDLKDAVEFPKVAEQALEMRVAGETKGRSLSAVRRELDKCYGDVLKLEQGANEIKLMFFQVAELVDEQDELLDTIDSNINQALDDSEATATLLKKAQAAKDAAERNAYLRCAFLPWWVRVLMLVILILLAPKIFECVWNYFTKSR